MSHFRNLVFEGGGVKGIAYVGALDELDQRGIPPDVRRVGGASAGAIVAVLVGLNYTTDEIRSVLWELDFKSFLDDSWGVIRDTRRLLTQFGWYKGDFFREWIGGVIERKTGDAGSTFAQVELLKASRGFRSLYFIGTNLSTRFSEVFSAERTPDMAVADAVRISMSIPLFFAAKRGARRDVYVDGGVLDNYPVKLFDRQDYVEMPEHVRLTDYYQRANALRASATGTAAPFVYNRETLGFRLDTREEIAAFEGPVNAVHHRIDNFFDYSWALVKTILETQQNTHLHSDDWQRTIYIDTLNVGTTDFDLSDRMKKALVESGRSGVRKYFAWYDDAEDAANKPPSALLAAVTPVTPRTVTTQRRTPVASRRHVRRPR